MGKISVPLPIAGLNTVDAVNSNPAFARELTNYMIFNGKLVMRPAVQLFDIVNTASSQPWWFEVAPLFANTFAIFMNGNIRNVATGAGATSIGGAPQCQPTLVKHVNLTLLIGGREPRLADNPFTAWTFTTSVITATAITSACSYRGRLYVCDGTTIEYSSVGQVTGAMYDSFNVSEFMQGELVERIFAFTINSGNNDEVAFVIFGENGRVLIYQGDYPASSTWDLIGDYNMPAPASKLSFVEIDGDIWVTTVRYPYWFRDLYSGGAQTAYANTPSKLIDNLWVTNTIWRDDSNYDFEIRSNSFYLPTIDAILCRPIQNTMIDDVADYGGVSYGLLVYFRKYNAWALWACAPIFAPVRDVGNGQIRGVCYNELCSMTYDSVQFPSYTVDTAVDPIEIETSWKTPYFNAVAGVVQTVTGVRVLFGNIYHGFLEKLRIIFDYSDFNNWYGFYTQSTVSQINPENYADDSIANSEIKTTYNLFSSVSGQGGGVSLQVTQKGNVSEEVSQEVLGAIIYITDGGDMI